MISQPPSVGIAPSPAMICYAGATSPGHTYPGGDITWRNTGDEPETVTFSVARSPAGAWLLTPASVILGPKQDVSVPVTLDVPPDAIENVAYTARIIATVTSSAVAGQPELSTSAGVNVEFGVGVTPPCSNAAVTPAVSASPAPKGKSKKNDVVLGGGIVLIAIAVAAFASRRRRRRRVVVREDRVED